MHTTPVLIQTMLHIYSCPQPLRDVPAVAGSLGRLSANGLIESIGYLEGESGYQCTKRGLCWINMLLDTPVPAPAFLDPRTNEAVSAEFRIGSGAPILPTTITDPEVPSGEDDNSPSYIVAEVPVVNIHDVMVEEEAKRASEVGPSAADLF